MIIFKEPSERRVHGNHKKRNQLFQSARLICSETLRIISLLSQKNCPQTKKDSSLLDIDRFLHIIMNHKFTSWPISSLYALYPTKSVHITRSSVVLGEMPVHVPGNMPLNMICESAE
jgi:hypothetical protein